MKNMINRWMLSICIVLLGCFYASAEVTKASFPGGKEALEKYISTNMKYPAAAKQNGIEGIVTVAFTVKTDGTIGSIKIVRMIDPDLEQEAIRLVKNMPKWQPAYDNGNPVDSSEEVPIPFLLEEK